MPKEHRESEKQRREATQAREEKNRRGDLVPASDGNERRRYIAQAREDEKRLREAAQAGTAEVEPGGHEVPRRAIKQMVSVRLEAQLLKDLRQLAEQQGLSISDLLRQAAIELVERSRATPVLMMLRSAGSAQVVTGALSASQATYGASTGTLVTEENSPVSSGDKSVRVLTASPVF
jgi:Ribbon-helix-helix protein, copG family